MDKKLPGPVDIVSGFAYASEFVKPYVRWCFALRKSFELSPRVPDSAWFPAAIFHIAERFSGQYHRTGDMKKIPERKRKIFFKILWMKLFCVMIHWKFRITHTVHCTECTIDKTEYIQLLIDKAKCYYLLSVPNCWNILLFVWISYNSYLKCCRNLL